MSSDPILWCWIVVPWDTLMCDVHGGWRIPYIYLSVSKAAKIMLTSESCSVDSKLHRTMIYCVKSTSPHFVLSYSWKIKLVKKPKGILYFSKMDSRFSFWVTGSENFVNSWCNRSIWRFVSLRFLETIWANLPLPTMLSSRLKGRNFPAPTPILGGGGRGGEISALLLLVNEWRIRMWWGFQQRRFRYRCVNWTRYVDQLF